MLLRTQQKYDVPAAHIGSAVPRSSASSRGVVGYLPYMRLDNCSWQNHREEPPPAPHVELQSPIALTEHGDARQASSTMVLVLLLLYALTWYLVPGTAYVEQVDKTQLLFRSLYLLGPYLV